jgi:hypothetical protein
LGIHNLKPQLNQAAMDTPSSAVPAPQGEVYSLRLNQQKVDNLKGIRVQNRNNE